MYIFTASKGILTSANMAAVIVISVRMRKQSGVMNRPVTVRGPKPDDADATAARVLVLSAPSGSAPDGIASRV